MTKETWETANEIMEKIDRCETQIDLTKSASEKLDNIKHAIGTSVTVKDSKEQFLSFMNDFLSALITDDPKSGIPMVSHMLFALESGLLDYKLKLAEQFRDL